MSYWVAGAAIVSGIGTALAGSSAAKSAKDATNQGTAAAANAQLQGNREGIAAGQQHYNRVVDLYSPDLTRGARADAITGAALYGDGSYDPTPDYSGLYADPAGTLAGETAGGQDWGGYLTANPDVLDAWHNQFDAGSRAKFNNDPRQYAEWHYNNFGRNEGRQLPTYGGGAGAGQSYTGPVYTPSGALLSSDALRPEQLADFMARGIQVVDASGRPLTVTAQGLTYASAATNQPAPVPDDTISYTNDDVRQMATASPWGQMAEESITAQRAVNDRATADALRDWEAKAGATGSYLSGNTIRGMSDINQRYGEETELYAAGARGAAYNDWYGGVAGDSARGADARTGISSSGANAANTAAQLYGQQGSNLANLYQAQGVNNANAQIAGANAWARGLNTAAGGVSNAWGYNNPGSGGWNSYGGGNPNTYGGGTTYNPAPFNRAYVTSGWG